MKNQISNIKLIVFGTFLLTGLTSTSQTQIGNDIDGEAANNWSGKSVSMANPTTVAIGAQSNDEVASGAGHVRIFDWNGSAWMQRGNDIDGRSSFDHNGTIVSMGSENTLAIGVPGASQGSNLYGRVEVHSWNGSAWTQKGSDILGISSGERFGYAVSMPDENTVAIGAQGGSAFPANQNGKVFIYEWDGNDWVQKGTTLIGEASNDNFGYAVNMPDPNTLAVSAPFNDQTGSDAGHVRIFSFNGSDWVQKGADIDGEAASDKSGWSISMADANSIAIGAPFNAGGGFQNGQVRIYTWNGTTWSQKGSDIDGVNIADQFGYSVSMPSADYFASGAPFSDNSSPLAGQVRIMNWNGSSWQQIGNSIDGEAQDDESGHAISMPDENTIAIGAYENEGNGNAAGHVRIYQLNGSNSIDENILNSIEIYPNPNDGHFFFRIPEINESIQLSIVDALGCKIYESTIETNLLKELDLELKPGLYHLCLSSNSQDPVTKQLIVR